MFVPSGGASIDMWNRHQSHHLNYNVQPWFVEHILSTLKPVGKWLVIDGELLHCKDASVKNTIYLWDVLVYNGEYLVGMSYGDRYALLQTLFKVPIIEEPFMAKVSENIWLARNIKPEQYDEAWKLTAISYIEGLVFKRLDGKLAPGIREQNNSDWMVRCRKISGRHKF